MKTLTSLGAALTAAVLAGTLTTGPIPAYAADTVDLSRPGQLERGDDIRVPHLVGDTIVDGDLRIEVPHAVSLLGPSGDDYVVETARKRRPRYAVKRVGADGDVTVLLRGKEALYTQLSGDGQHLLRNDNQPRTTITAYDTTDGTEIDSLTIRRYAQVLDAEAGTVLVSAWSPRPRTVAWDIDAGTRTQVADQVGYTADISADRLGLLTGDPYQDGCARTVALSEPDVTLWESCRQRVYAFSPAGDLTATVHILADGLGPNVVELREVDGTLLTSYEAVWFNHVYWEDADTLLLEANGKRKAATVRCDGTDCERASRLRRSRV